MYQKPSVANVALTLAGTEYSYAIPTNTRKLYFGSRKGGNLQFAFAAGTSGSTFITNQAGQQGFWIDAMYLKGETIYVQSDEAADTLEVIVFKDLAL